MSLDARLSKVMPALSPRERGTLMLRSYKEVAADPLLRTTTQPEHVDEVNHYIALINASNIHLESFINQAEMLTDQEWTKFHWAEAVHRVTSFTWQIAELVPAGKRRQVEEVVARSRLPVDLPWKCDDKQVSWLDLNDALVKALGRGVAIRWAEVRAAEIVADEVAEGVWR